MAVVGWREIAKGRSVSGKYGESNNYTRAFLVRVDNPATSQVEIAAAPGIVYGTPHPNQEACVAMEFEASVSDDVGLWWTVTVKYYIPPPEKKPADDGTPEDVWVAGCSTSTGPVYEDAMGLGTITNSAGDPIEGLEKENDDVTWSLTTSYTTMQWAADALEHSNTVNDYDWAGGDPYTWKVNFKGAQKKRVTKTTTTGGGDAQDDGAYSPATVTEEEVEYWEVRWDFRYRADGWKARPWDVGFNTLCDEEGNPATDGTQKRAILGADGKPVRHPAALADGVAKAVGEKPDIINGGEGVEIYKSTSFELFGEPS